MLPPEIREQMIRQGAEVKRLKEQLDRELEHHQETKTELNETIQNLMNEKNELNEKISKLEQVIFSKYLPKKFFCGIKLETYHLECNGERCIGLRAI